MSIMRGLFDRGKATETPFDPTPSVPRSNAQEAVQFVMDNAGGGGGPGVGAAPDDAQYLVSSSNGDLTNERVVGNGTGIAWDFSGIGTGVANLDFHNFQNITDPGADRGLMWNASTGGFDLFEATVGLGFSAGTLSITDTDVASIVNTTFSAGDILWHNGSTFQRLAAGLSGRWLRTNAGLGPFWDSLPAGNGMGDMLQSANLSDVDDPSIARTNLGVEIGSDVQAWDATLESIASLGTAADRIAYTTGVDTWAETPLTSFARSILDDADEATFKATVNLEPGIDVQTQNATLQSLSALGTAADRIAYTTGASTWAETALTSFARSILDDASEADFKATVNLEIGVDVQAYSTNLDSWSGEVPTDYALLADLASTTNGKGASLIGIEDSAGLITATTVEGALAEMAQDIAALDNAVVLKGTWDASSGSFPGAGAAQPGWSYIVSVSGTVDGVAFTANDRILAIAANASTSTYAANWHKLDYTDQVLSVAGKTGAVTLDTDDITDMSANGRSLVTAANYAAMRGLLDLEAGTDFNAYSDRLADVAGISWTQGDIMYFNGTNLVRLAPGTAGYLLKTNGVGANPEWAEASGSGTVTSITAGVGITTGGSPITSTGTVSLNYGIVDPTAAVESSNTLTMDVNNGANLFFQDVLSSHVEVQPPIDMPDGSTITLLIDPTNHPTTAPAVAARSQGQTSGGTSHSITLPSGISAGNLLVCFFSVDGNPTVTVDTGSSGNNWVKLGQASNGSSVTGAVFYKIAEGSDVLVLTTSASEEATHICFRITGAMTNVADISGTSSNGSSTNGNPPLHTPTFGTQNYLSLVSLSTDAQVVATVAPSGYGNLTTQAASTSSGASTSVADLQLSAAASEDPGAFTNANEQWVCWTVLVSPYGVYSVTWDSAFPAPTPDITVETLVQIQSLGDGRYVAVRAWTAE